MEASHHSRTSEPSYSSPRGLPLLRPPRLRVVPFLGLAVVQTTTLVLSAPRGQHGQRPTSIGRVLYVERLATGSRRPKCLRIMRKIIIPPPDSRDPLDGPPHFVKKLIRPLTDGTHELHLRTQGSVSEKNVPLAVSSDPPEVPPYYAQNKNKYYPG